MIIWANEGTIWINKNGTSFTMLSTEQKFGKNIEGKWLN
jgi:hypothetical protein